MPEGIGFLPAQHVDLTINPALCHGKQALRGVLAVQKAPDLLSRCRLGILSLHQLAHDRHDQVVLAVIGSVDAENACPDMAYPTLPGMHAGHKASAQLTHAVSVLREGRCTRREQGIGPSVFGL